MPVSREVVIFNEENIQSWSAEYQPLPNQITNLKSENSSSRARIDNLQPQIDKLDKEIAALRVQISRINDQIERIRDQQQANQNSSHLQVQHGNTQTTGSGHARHGHGAHPQHSHTNGIAGFFDTVGGIVSAVDTASKISGLLSSRDDLNRQLSTLEDQLSPLRQQVRQSESRIRENERTLAHLEPRCWELKALIDQGNKFLFNLKSSPQTLLEQISALITAEFLEYANKFPARQSKLIRKRLRDIPQKMQFILSNKWSYKGKNTLQPESLDGIKSLQYQYYLLCGLLWDVLNQTDANEKEFSETLMKILRETHIAENGDLPDGLGFNSACNDNYLEFVGINSEHPQIKDLTDEQLDALELQEYNTALKDLNRTIKDTHEPFKTKAQDVVNIIELMKTKKDDFDIAFSTKILLAQNNLLQSPFPKNISAYKSLADHATGAPSLKKKLVGAMLILLGLVTLATCIAVTIASFGVGSASFFGVAVAATVVTKSLGITFGILGLASLITGIGLFASGIRKGVSKKMVQLTDAFKDKKKNVIENGKSEEDEAGVPLMEYERSALNAALLN